MSVPLVAAADQAGGNNNNNNNNNGNGGNVNPPGGNQQHNARSIQHVLHLAPKFSGRENASHWYRDFTDLCTAFGYTTVAHRHPLIKFCQTEEALQWSRIWCADPANAGATEQQYLDAWTNKWIGMDRTRLSKAKRAFQKATKRSSQTYVDFGHYLKYLALDMNPAPTDDDIIEQCKTGVNGEVRDRIISRRPTTFADLIGILEIVDEIDKNRTSSTEEDFEKYREKQDKKSQKKKDSPKVGSVQVNSISQHGDHNRNDSDEDSGEDFTDKQKKQLGVLQDQLKVLTDQLSQLTTLRSNAVSFDKNTSSQGKTPAVNSSGTSHSSSGQTRRPQTPYNRSRSQSRDRNHNSSRSRSNQQRSDRHRSKSPGYHAYKVMMAQAELQKSSQRESRSFSKDKMTCHYCGKTGHFIRECQERQRDLSRDRREFWKNSSRRQSPAQSRHTIVHQFEPASRGYRNASSDSKQNQENQ